MSFSKAIARDAEMIAARLDRAMAGMGDEAVVQAMRYAVQGGKRLRGFLVLESARMLGVEEHRAISAAASVEAWAADVHFARIARDKQVLDMPDLAVMHRPPKVALDHYSPTTDFWRAVPGASALQHSEGNKTLKDTRVEDGDLILLQDSAVPLLRRTHAEETAHAMQARSPPPGARGPGGGANGYGSAGSYNMDTTYSTYSTTGGPTCRTTVSWPKAKEKALKINAGGSKAKAAEEAKAGAASSASGAGAGAAGPRRYVVAMGPGGGPGPLGGGGGGGGGLRIVTHSSGGGGGRRAGASAAGDEDSDGDGDAVAPMAPMSARVDVLEAARARALGGRSSREPARAVPQTTYPLFGHGRAHRHGAAEEEPTLPPQGGGMSVFDNIEAMDE